MCHAPGPGRRLRWACGRTGRRWSLHPAPAPPAAPALTRTPTVVHGARLGHIRLHLLGAIPMRRRGPDEGGVGAACACMAHTRTHMQCATSVGPQPHCEVEARLWSRGDRAQAARREGPMRPALATTAAPAHTQTAHGSRAHGARVCIAAAPGAGSPP